MLFTDFITEDLLNNIPYLAENESANITYLYNWLKYNYGERTVSPVAENISDSVILGNIISLMYSDKWKTLKNALLADIPLTEKTEHKVETVENSIFGYNDETGTNDYKNTKTTDTNKQYDDVFTMLKNNIDFRTMMNYYSTVVEDIASTLTLSIYE